MNSQEYNNEVNALERERKLKEQIVDSYKNRLINEIQSVEIEEVVEIKKIPKKSLWKKIFSSL